MGEIYVRIDGLIPAYYRDLYGEEQMARAHFTFDVRVVRASMTWEEAVEAFGRQTTYRLVPVEEDE